MKKLDDLLGLADEPIEVTPPRSKKPIRLRWPSFGEWHDLAVAHRHLDGKEPPAELIAKTVAVCLADEDGNRKYQDADVGELLASNPRTLMWIYVKCWDTVLRNDEQAVKEEEGK
jgi:hypothetical protein